MNHTIIHAGADSRDREWSGWLDGCVWLGVMMCRIRESREQRNKVKTPIPGLGTALRQQPSAFRPFLLALRSNKKSTPAQPAMHAA